LDLEKVSPAAELGLASLGVDPLHLLVAEVHHSVSFGENRHLLLEDRAPLLLEAALHVHKDRGTETETEPPARRGEAGRWA
jgi:hypothetical protein